MIASFIDVVCLFIIFDWHNRCPGLIDETNFAPEFYIGDAIRKTGRVVILHRDDQCPGLIDETAFSTDYHGCDAFMKISRLIILEWDLGSTGRVDITPFAFQFDPYQIFIFFRKSGVRSFVIYSGYGQRLNEGISHLIFLGKARVAKTIFAIDQCTGQG